MSNCDSPLIICRLSNERGEILNPYDPGSIKFTRLCSTVKKSRKPSASTVVTVRISGYVVIYVEGRDTSPPVPFRITTHFSIFAPDDSYLEFQVRKFACTAVPILVGTEVAEVDVAIHLEVAARSFRWADVLVQPVNQPEKLLLCVKKICDCACFCCETSVILQLFLLAIARQYNALANANQKHYTNADELTEYGQTGILPPSEDTVNSLFVNGMLQPDATYALWAGNLLLLTDNAPIKGATVIISFVTFGKNHGKNVMASNDTYVTQSDGTKRVFYNSDELIEYGGHGIPSPDAVSFFNLYVNGTLQPRTNFRVSEGVLELTTTDLPPAGVKIVLEYFTIKDEDGKLLNAQVYEYNAFSNGHRIYTNADEIAMYGTQGIPDPALYSYEHLFINNILQPSVNYSVQKGLLTLNTADAPLVGAPVTLQFVCIFTS